MPAMLTLSVEPLPDERVILRTNLPMQVAQQILDRVEQVENGMVEVVLRHKRVQRVDWKHSELVTYP